jgi:hypothetical protein
LRPPHAEFRPGFWEQHGAWFVAAAIVVLGAAAFWITRLRQPASVPVTPPEEIARRALEPLRGRTEDAALTAQVSQIIRKYVISAFDLPPDELTSGELIKSLQANRQVVPELIDVVGNFLKQCDERKFGPPPTADRTDTVAVASQLIADIESHLRKMPVTTQSTEPATRAV